MKQQFKFNPLATAIFSLLCGSSVASYAESAEQPSSAVDNRALKTAIEEAYPGQAFFAQHYVSKNDPAAASRDLNNPSNRWCDGVWVTPFDSNQATLSPEQGSSVITADNAYYNPAGDSEISGNVLINQQGRLLRADEVKLDRTQTYAKATGNVQLAQGGLIAQSEKIDYNLRDETGQLDDSFYISEATHGHGHAEKIERTSPQHLVLSNASYTTCPPDETPTWKIQAKNIEIDQETGRGVTRNTKLYVKNVPVMAIPYFNFPIDDRRTTGLLNPNFGYSNEGGFQVAAPVYLNLAPNYDATITPRLYSDRGLMLDGEFRYLTENFGHGQFSGGYLYQDRKYDDKDRKDFHWLHSWAITPQWSANAEYNYVSDKDFFADLNNNPNTKTELNQRRALALNYGNGIPGLSAQLKVEDFQTLDKSIAQVDRPYARLPQFLLNYVNGNPLGFEFEFSNDTAYFKKNIDDFETQAQPNGTRLYNQLDLRYNYRTPYSFVVPTATLRTLNTFYDQDTINNFGLDSSNKSKSVVVPQFTLDAGLTFEREGTFLQTISPRAFYAYAPYKKQDDYPNFDTTTASINYDQLFNPYRFYGHDRLDDNNFLSLGLSYSLFDRIGLERLRASVGQSYYFEDRRVTLQQKNDTFDTERKTGPIVSVSSQLSQNISISANAAWTAHGDNAQRDFQAYYAGERGNLYSVGYFNRRELIDRQKAYDQVTASFVQPVFNNWRIIGHAQYDIDNHVGRNYLLGINYESCCWGVSVYGRSYYNDLDNVNEPGVKAKRAIMAEFTFKGLGGLNNKLSSLLDNRVLGFEKVNQSWTH
ncbi:LPS-assembly protein LptD [Acinetobacter larvae]|uniref:LPS-assembly protein LptD n=1 Tax=Acinetobacter larvae TaxID=1789224 RepID=A0A1B2M406_9GAMM|nr:LPS-assembly protein LptD [Acinetobacter larvae]AOA59899.1 LPS export ABC transporter periplasmic protein LptC [Acinetobacter larvae]